MKVKELIKMLSMVNGDFEVMIYSDGSIYPTAEPKEVISFNLDNDSDEFYIVTTEFE